MYQISEHVNSSNNNIHSYYQMQKVIVKLSNNKCKNNNKFTDHFNQTQKLLLMIIVDSPEKDLSNVDRKANKRKIRTSLINPSSELFPISILAMYNKFHHAQNQRLMLNSFIPVINTSIVPRTNDENIFSGKLINELHSWIENHPHVIH